MVIGFYYQSDTALAGAGTVRPAGVARLNADGVQVRRVCRATAPDQRVTGRVSVFYMTDRTDDRREPTVTDACGTIRGYRRHLRAGEKTCRPCRAANAAYTRSRKEKVAKGEPTAPPTKKAKREAEERAGQTVVEVTAGDVEDDARQPYPAFLKQAGRKLWRDVTAEYELNPAALQVLAHACRMTDKVERFDAALSARSTLWFELDVDEADVDKGVPVVVNGMISEGRQLSAAIRSALNQIGVLKTQAGGKGTSIQDQIKAKREERLAKAKGASA